MSLNHTALADYFMNPQELPTPVTPKPTSSTPNPFAQSQVVREGYHMGQHRPVSPRFLSPDYYNPQTISRVKSETNKLVSSQVRNEEVVKGESRVSYVPYEKKVIEYENRTYVEKVPVKRKVTNYEEKRVVETIPHEVVKQDYYAVEKKVQYYKEIIPEKTVEMVPVQRKVKRYEYVPVERQIVHYPGNVDVETAKSQSRVVLREQGVEVKSDAEFKPLNSALIYNYSTRPSSKLQPIGYVDQGHSRTLSNAPTPMRTIQSQPWLDYGGTQIDSQQHLQGGESYIRSLSNIGVRPFEVIERNAGLQRVATQPAPYHYPEHQYS